MSLSFALWIARHLVAPVELGWQAPADCPDAAAAQAVVARLLGDAVHDPERAVRADVRIERDTTGFRARVRIDQGERELVAQSCEEIADAAALIVAMAIDPRIGGAGEPTAIPEPPPTIDPPAAVPIATTPPAEAIAIERPAPPPPPRPRRARPRAILRAGGGVGIGAVRAASAVTMLAVAIAGRRWRVELDGAAWLPRTRPGPDATGIRVVGWSVGLRGCGSPVAARVEVPICAGVRAGALHGRGVGDLDAHRRRVPWIAATLGTGLWGWITPRFALALDVDGELALTRPAFVVEPAGFVVRAPRAGVRALFGPAVRLP